MSAFEPCHIINITYVINSALLTIAIQLGVLSILNTTYIINSALLTISIQLGVLSMLLAHARSSESCVPVASYI